MHIFPQPQKITTLPETLTLAQGGKLCCMLVLARDPDPMEALAAETVSVAIAKATGQRAAWGAAPGGGVTISIGRSAASISAAAERLAETPDSPEAYALVAQGQQIALLGRTPTGTLYAAQTFAQMLRSEGEALVVDGAAIADWPDFRYRGLFVESKWGPDLMGLDDWKELIDYLAALKFNSLGIGVYGCWGVQYDGRRTEFLMVPFPDHPELQTPKTIRYYSAKSGAWKSLTYLPRMFEEDFFGEVVAYARARNIMVRPHFNGPGHTTLIPHTHPEIAAKNAAGQPESYGYCLSNPATYDLLFELWDSIIDRYLLPNGVDWFHMGLDEIWPMAAIDEDAPERVVDPWCKCDLCRERTPNDLLVDYVVRATQHLVAKGMNNITLWNDHLERHGILTPEFVSRLEEAGVKDKVALQWWRYNEPVLEIRPELGLRAWTTPMPGYWFWLFTQSYTSNIYPHLHMAYRAGAEGADAYCTFDPAYDRNYVCLAEYAWNQTTSGDLYRFKSRYAEKVTGMTGFDAAEAFEKWDQVYDSHPLVRGLLDALLYYWYTYSNESAVYPRNAARALLADKLRAAQTYRAARLYLDRARHYFTAARPSAPDLSLIDEYLWECDRLIAVVDAFDAITGAARHYSRTGHDKGALESSAGALRRGLAALDGMMARAEEVKRAYLVPQILRDLSPLRSYLAEMLAAIESAAASPEAASALDRLMAELGA